MKKIIFTTSIIAAGLFFNSCTKNKVAEIKTFQFDIQPSDWYENGTAGQSNHLYYISHSIPDITDAVVSSGTVLGYMGNSSVWLALPYTETYPSYISEYNYQYQAGAVYILLKDSDLFTSPPAGIITIKIVVLTEIEKNILIENNVDVKNYEEVSRVLEF